MKTLLLIATSLILVSCAGRQPYYDTEELDPVDSVEVFENYYHPQEDPESYVDIECVRAREDAEYIAKILANKKGCSAVSLTDIEESSLWNDYCFRTRLNFYKKAKGLIPSDTLIKYIEPMKMNEYEFSINFGFGAVLSGTQDKPGLVSENGKEAETSKAGIGSKFIYHMNEYLAFGPILSFDFASAQAPKTKAMDFFNQINLGLRVEVSPLTIIKNYSIYQIYIPFAYYLSSISFDEEYISFVEENEPGIILFREWSSGSGFYTGLGYKFFKKNGMTMGFELLYYQEEHKFENATESIDGKGMQFGIQIGYSF